MASPLYLPSKEFQKVLKISGCELMHQRELGKLSFIKKGNSYQYLVKDKTLLINHPLYNQLVNWYEKKHPIKLNNAPQAPASTDAIIGLIENILIPVKNTFGDIEITYGFVSAELNRFIQKNSPSGTSPTLDQHASSELNNNQNNICKRDGIACDFVITGYESNMTQVMQYIVENLNFDKLYFYGNNRPIHVSYNKAGKKHLQIMNESEKGRRIPGKKAFGDKANQLAKEQN